MIVSVNSGRIYDGHPLSIMHSHNRAVTPKTFIFPFFHGFNLTGAVKSGRNHAQPIDLTQFATRKTELL